MGRGRARARSTVVVPDVRGLSVAEADVVAAHADLVITGPDGRPTSSLPGLITDQRPDGGAQVPRHTGVVVWTTGPGGESGVREPRVPPLPHRAGGAAADRTGLLDG
jgi:beta-lactam-binding protein with PASTA domain